MDPESNSPGSPKNFRTKAEDGLTEALLAGEYVFLVGSDPTKRALALTQAIVRLKEAKVAVAWIDLQRIGLNVTPMQWYAGIQASIGQALGLAAPLLKHWRANRQIGPLARWIAALQSVVLAQCERPIVIFVDEIESMRSLPFPTDEFIAGIRDCYNRRSEDSEFERLTFCLVGAVTPGQLIRNPGISPFNIGRKIEVS